MKRRISALLLSFIMVFSLTTTAFAAVTPSLSQTTLHSGEEVDVTLTLDETLEKITNFEYHIYFDADLFELVKGTNGIANSHTTHSQALIDDGFRHKGESYYAVSFVDTLSKGQTIQAGELYTLKFKAKKDVAEDVSSTFRVYKESLADTSFRQIKGGEVNSGSLSVSVTPAQKNSYTVSLTPERQSAHVGGAVQVGLNISAQGYTKFNAADVTVNYDPDALTFKKEASKLEGFEVKDSSGTVHLVAYGTDKPLGQVLTLAFEAKTVGSTEVTLTGAKLDDGENASVQNAPEAEKDNIVAAVAVDGYPVMLPEEFTGAASAEPNADYVFAAKDRHYDYTFAGSTMGGVPVEVKDNGDGTFTVSHVTGAVVIVSDKAAKTYGVTVKGAGAADVAAASTAAYGSDFVFTVRHDANYHYALHVTVDGKAYTGFRVQEDTCTIPGADVTGDVVITVDKTVIPENQFTVHFEGSGAGDVTGAATVLKNTKYAFTVQKTEGYAYTVTAQVGDRAVNVSEKNGTYTIAAKDVTGDVTITVDKQIEKQVAVNEYVKLDGKTMFLVSVTGKPEEGKTFAYDGVPMFYSEKYQAYCWLVISEEVLDASAVEEHIQVAAADDVRLHYDLDINGTQVVDINDAQMTYNMYNAKYADFAEVPMDKFLKADTNGSKNLNVEDAAVIVHQIING